MTAISKHLDKRAAPRPRADANAANDDARWAAVNARDAAFDGAFYYAVSTTGVYCRPSCPSRRPNRANVSFHATCADAERAGFRACQRCHPNGDGLSRQHAAIVAEACRAIEAADTPLPLAQLARGSGLSAFHFHKVFRRVTGVTPKAYCDALRQRRALAALPRAANVTEAIYEAGFNASGRFYDGAKNFLGMTPRAVRRKGADQLLRFAVGESSLGAILVAASDKGVAAILIGDDPAELLQDLQQRFRNATLVGGDRQFEDVVAKVVGLIEAPGSAVDLPLDIRGTAFQHRVWQALRQIPAGATASYADIAQCVGMPKSVRAVAAACAANHIAVAIPCHRVVRTDGALAGYRWGIERKRALLEREHNSIAARSKSGTRRA